MHTLGTALQFQEEGYHSFLPPPSQGRKGSHPEEEILTLCLNSVFSSKVMVSALAITGMMFTTLLRCFMNSRSKGRKLQPKKEKDGRGHFLPSLPFILVTVPASGHPRTFPCTYPTCYHHVLISFFPSILPTPKKHSGIPPPLVILDPFKPHSTQS